MPGYRIVPGFPLSFSLLVVASLIVGAAILIVGLPNLSAVSITCLLLLHGSLVLISTNKVSIIFLLRRSTVPSSVAVAFALV